MATNATPGSSGEGVFSSSFDTNPFGGSAARRSNSAFGSPTSTISSPAQAVRMPMRTNPSTSSAGTPQRKAVIKSDPTMISCFDTSDKELYDLWAPKQ
ncbi:hypothetical protein SCHPADRAFT_859219 [Schizopora paradoxa]|uniref:Uncharacterized protein n=1 Tax=Schizopora paradoxa TaxID=27342 RepID=A0A0H2R8V2_9AGAM|nr:hypothetical protein SCHPADRAFT_859219 [Schizopora paradoxa]